MREIKFRAQNFGGFWYHSDKYGLAEFFNFLECDHPVLNKLTLGQFTGLKDKNGKEIFESDRLRWDGDVYEIHYVCGEWILWHSGDPENDRPSLANIIKPSGSNVEVIGNIYENPDLMRQSNKSEV